MRFVADSMLGKLAKWLRVLGYDTRYKSHYGPGVIDQLVEDGRTFLSRQVKIVNSYDNAVLLQSHDTGGQLAELKEKIGFEPDGSKLFSRCLICNVLLEEADISEAKENVPEYVFYENMMGIRFCPSCCRYFWPGSHRERMARKLREWGFG
ncbi:MAG: Mut7-C RNAse domain-containing protein [Desulfobacteraceae bacterium]|nr:Mut7-C RNAse domain-containing protein [Desulfobacteraceae bacterium]